MSILLERHSVRKFEEKAIEPEKLEYMMRAAMQSPSSHNQRPWEFYIVRNREVIQQLSEATPFSKCAAGAPVVIASVYRKECKIPRSVHIDMAACMENLWLAAVEQGLGGVWIGIAPLEERMEKVGEILSLPDSVSAFGLFAVGYPFEDKETHSRYNEERVHFVD